MGTGACNLAEFNFASTQSAEDSPKRCDAARDDIGCRRCPPSPASRFRCVSPAMITRRKLRNAQADGVSDSPMQLALLAETGGWTTSSRLSKKAAVKGTGMDHRQAVPALAVATRPAARATISSSTVIDTMPCSDDLLHMRDLVRVTRRHRSTIYRRIKRKLFPEQRTHKGKKIGWARSDIERWMQGDPVLDG